VTVEGRPTRYALIPTRDRPAELARLTAQLVDWCDFILIIDNGSTPPVAEVELRAQHPGVTIIVVSHAEQPPHLYRMWNMGFESAAAAEIACQRAHRVDSLHEWDVVVLNDDAVLPDGWLDYVSEHLRQTGAVAASTYPHHDHGAPLLKSRPDGSITTRLCPWAFIVRGEVGLRADENFHWWWGDTDFDWQACAAGGVLLLPGLQVANTCANTTTIGELAEQASRDGETFARKWGRRPW
jgi:hypothetical protein